MIPNRRGWSCGDLVGSSSYLTSLQGAQTVKHKWADGRTVVRAGQTSDTCTPAAAPDSIAHCRTVCVHQLHIMSSLEIMCTALQCSVMSGSHCPVVSRGRIPVRCPVQSGFVNVCTSQSSISQIRVSGKQGLYIRVYTVYIQYSCIYTTYSQ